MAYIEGHIDHVIHQTPEGYFVLAVAVHDTDFAVRDKIAKVSGHLCGLKMLRNGITLRITGEWVSHPKWGRQLKPSGWDPWATTNMARVRFLNECIEGFDDADLTNRLVEEFGHEVFDALSDTKRCQAIMAEGDSRQAQLSMMLLHWRTSRTLLELSRFLQAYGMGPESVKDIYYRFGHDVIEIISKNPYRLTAVDGFPFERADRIASRLGIPRDDPRRVEGIILWILRMEGRQGHLYVRRNDLPNLLRDMIATEQIDPFQIDNLHEALQASVVQLAEAGVVTVDPSVGIYLPEYFLYERGSARKLSAFLTPSELQVDLDVFLSEYQSGNQIELSDAQRDAVRKLVEHRVLVLTGLPGTGKTTVIRALVSVFKRAKLSFSLMAPTGIAAKRLESVTGEKAMTIHRTLGFNGAAWNYHGGFKFGVGAVIVDEMSMVDQELFYRVLDALHPSTMVVLVGDDAQLPSVGPGNVLRELVQCKDIPDVRLTQIFRQAATSDIVVASHKINQGKSPLAEVKNNASEFQFAQMSDESVIVDFIVEAAAKLKGRDANFQVLSPKYDGDVGVNNLNDRLRERLNPEGAQKEWKAGKFHVREGDRLMVVKNDYKLNIYNGDMGKLLTINRDDLLVKIHGIGAGSIDTHVNIPKTNAMNVLKLAYAITVHKSQGSEFDTVILPITRSQGRMLQRNLFYTAVTRARKKVWLLGDAMSVLKAIANDKVVQRNTVFGRVVTEAYEALRAEQAGVGDAPGAA
jgi:exodeoxyribonuclease V alpha subunit